jgi:hypothetical protein
MEFGILIIFFLERGEKEFQELGGHFQDETIQIK